MGRKRKAITPDMMRKWAEMAHVFFIDALSSGAPLALKQIAFHGGTNLHLSWGSPRFSEDLDFLVNRDFAGQMRDVMPRIERRMRSMMSAVDPSLQVKIDDRTREGSNLINFRIVITSPEIVGQSMVKAEFWQVGSDYLSDYETCFKHPVARGDIMSRLSQPLPAGTLEAAYADKVVALGNRPHLKWRDLFDLWWITGQEKVEPAAMVEQIRHQASAYTGPDGQSLSEGLRKFLERDPVDVMSQADPDLRRWLPKAFWDAVNPDGIREMVDRARHIAEVISTQLEARVEIQPDPDAAMRDHGPRAQEEVHDDAYPCP